MKDGLKDIIGRQVAAVVVARSDKGSPRNQVFLVFTDGSNFEFWGDSFTCCGGVDRTRDIARYIKSGAEMWWPSTPIPRRSRHRGRRPPQAPCRRHATCPPQGSTSRKS